MLKISTQIVDTWKKRVQKSCAMTLLLENANMSKMGKGR